VCASIKSVKMIYIETPANPTIDCYDIEALCAVAKKRGIKSAVDNTFATPYLQQPFRWGADFIVHSSTKFLNGHGNAISGVLVAKDKEWMKTRLMDVMKLIGSNANPFNAWLLNNGIKTLELRMERHCDNAMALANFLSSHRAVSKTNYNGLQSHSGFKLTQKQMRRAGGMLSFELKQGLDGGKRFIKNLKLATLAVSLGTLDTIVQHPASMSHVKVDKQMREKHGITDGLIRVSVGIENVDDLLNDFDQALKS
ncbi:MAG TPA: PLP-dependent transferase, partial [Chitinophagales bacterium]|nr:PLP-dependent transferase [Chitinophagales bacterium]